ncbi:MAG: glucose PTS transporter subunit IIA, partial [Leuconostoc falkenbergense]|uniref:glucose PTS transporter subunit IIA n=1 Tax=Leuconostoc falkenbergense TaxID=2766470 RepID=UPI003F98BF58
YLYNCTTRLRYKMTDTALADVNALKHAPGVMGVNVLDQHQIHIVIGPDVQFVADNIQNIYDGNLSPMLATPLKSSEMTTARTTTPANHTTVESLFAVADGQLLHLEHVKDDTFASKVMGDGFAIEPINGNVLSPIDGEITMIAPTQHAIGIKTERGTDVLVHMGIDTVAMNGAPFDLKIAVGDHVKHGDLLADMNIEAIHQADKMATIMVICLELPETATVKIDDELDFDGHGGNYVGQIMY